MMRPLARRLLAVPVLALLVLPQPAGAQSASPRPPITDRLADLRRIHTPNGVERLEAVPIGGVSQWINVRGKDERAPVIVMIHGGPDTPTMPTTWAYQAPWGDFFTVVHHDQRGVNWARSG